ncbi:T9SS type A sorting domain-containing protein [Dyadobacter sp. CY345]|uniref:T9SS type A sorting domain-containing protein n=1 Tax=Dyadobacter sp. CY345 TaxID=2909335 RepID=UPI001F21F5B7|nr:T9SS type A sorting domain-containing protein [Dyadobacter sp. CY345]MCF2443377.1 T9SS type A sorting domain-containing protein [Dyadobacter sp. CY345]
MDGSFAYSQIRSLTGSESADKLALFPNPISSSGQKLQFNNLPSQLQKIELVSIAGIVTYSIEKPSSQGINIEGVSKGLYIVKAILQNGQMFSSRLLIR